MTFVLSSVIFFLEKQVFNSHCSIESEDALRKMCMLLKVQKDGSAQSEVINLRKHLIER